LFVCFFRFLLSIFIIPALPRYSPLVIIRLQDLPVYRLYQALVHCMQIPSSFPPHLSHG
jgi:hypothetical protein